MEIVNVRVDDRLIHGQVATVWTQVTKTTRIMIVDNEVVKDPINKEALKLACPEGCKLSILTVAKAVENLLAAKYVGERLFIIVKNPRTLVAMYDAGFRFAAFNIGNMGGKANTKMVCKAVSVSDEDIKNILYLAENNVTVTAQMVPTDEVIDFVALVQV